MRGFTRLFGWLAVLAWAVTLPAAEAPAFRTRFPRRLIGGQPVLVCARVRTPPKIDGEVDKDPVWSRLPRDSRTHGAWTQLARQEVSGRQTVVYSCYDKENLYFAFVCEEKELQNVRMDGGLTQSFQPAGPDDCVEAILEIGGTQGDGEVYSFRANQRAQLSAWGLTAIPKQYEYGFHVPAWKAVGKLGPNRWMLEMAIPFATIKRLPGQKGLTTPSRGDVMGLKLVRWGAQQQDPKNRMVSVWNTDIAFTTPYIAGTNGLLYFQDSNSLRDGGFALPAADSPWERKGQVAPAAQGGVSLGKDAGLTQTVDVHPNCFYLLSVEGEGEPDVLLDGKKLALKNGQAGFWTTDGQEKAVLALQAAEPIRLKQVLIQFQPGEKPAGSWCLTNNYRHADRDLRTVLPEAPEGRYQYVNLDYQNRRASDGNPSIDIRSWCYDYNLRVEDVGGKKGWIPFGKGSLTGRPEPVFWQTTNPSDPVCWGRHTLVVDTDLGQAYFVRGVDVLLPGPNMINFEVWGKLKAEDDWTVLHMANGQFVEPSRRRSHRRAWESVVGLDSVVRYVRWRVSQAVGAYAFPQMDGIQEFWVWGEPKGGRAGIKPFDPWVPREGAPPTKWTTTAPDPDVCLIIPRPRRWEKADGWFVIGPQTRIVAQPDAEARKVAKQIRDEIRERWQIDVPLAEEPPDAGAQLDDVVYVGQPRLNPLAERLRLAEGLTIEPGKPQAYALGATRRRVVVLGADDQGLYWGVQSLMMAMRWHSSKDPTQNGVGVRCMKVEDWPATLDRSVFYTEGTLLAAIESEIPRILRNVHLQTRFKWNASYCIFDPAIVWSPGRIAEVCRQIRENHHMEVRPMLLTPPATYLGGWNRVVQEAKDLSVVEHDPDEAPEDLGVSLNLCPLKPRTYDLVFSRIDRFLEQYGWPSKIWLGGLVCHDPSGGSRWAVCRECLKSGKSKDELFAHFAEQVARHLRERHATGVVEPHAVAFGDREHPKWKRAIVAADVRALPGDIEYILPSGLSPGNNEALKARLRPSLTADGAMAWPSAERLFRGPMSHDLETLRKSNKTYQLAGFVPTMEEMWYGPDKRPAGEYDWQDLYVWGNCWHFRRDLPSWRAGDRPGSFTLDLRPFANHTGHPTGMEPLEPGRTPAVDLRYVPKGRQLLSGVEFDLIDPATNDGKSILMLGRPIPGVTHPKDARTVSESAGPIPVQRKMASLVFLHAGWQASTQSFLWGERWLLPVCRVVYDDDSWLPVDSFRIHDKEDYWNEMTVGNCAGLPQFLERVGWLGNCPGGSVVLLRVSEWVNPYPEKTVKCLQFVTPAYEEGEDVKRPNPQCQGIVAMTGVEPIEQDFNYWSKRPDRLPLLPPVKPPQRAAVAVKRLWEDWRGGRVTLHLKGPAGESTSTLELTPGAAYATNRTARSDCGMVYCNANYKPFDVVQTFDPPTRLCRVDVRGPSYGVDHEYSFGRTHRIDVTVKISEDGETWRRAGGVKGIAGDADFQPVEFEPALVKKLRLTADPGPYHEEYNPGMAHPVARLDYPYFVWRLFTPAASAEVKK